MTVIATEQAWQAAVFGVAVAAVIAATRVRFAVHAAALLLFVLAVMAAAGAGVGGGNAVTGDARSSTTHHSGTGATRLMAGRARRRSSRPSKRIGRSR